MLPLYFLIITITITIFTLFSLMILLNYLLKYLHFHYYIGIAWNEQIYVRKKSYVVKSMLRKRPLIFWSDFLMFAFNSKWTSSRAGLTPGKKSFLSSLSRTPRYSSSSSPYTTALNFPNRLRRETETLQSRTTLSLDTFSLTAHVAIQDHDHGYHVIITWYHVLCIIVRLIPYSSISLSPKTYLIHRNTAILTSSL